MKNLVSKCLALVMLAAAVVLLPQPAQAQPNSLVTYAGSAGQEKLLDLLRLSDGTCLVAGTAQDLNWLPAGVPRTVLAGAGGLHNGSSATPRIGFILHLSADLGTVLRVVSLPPGAAESIAHLKTTNVPGQPTSTLFISGSTADTEANAGGYFLARLNNNFVQSAPTALAWTYNVQGAGYVADYQPWDVGADGRVVFVTGQSHSASWCAAHVLDGTTGLRAVVPNWRTHWLSTGAEYRGLAASAPAGTTVSYSGIVFKKSGRCDLRSWTTADYTAVLPDGNGRTKQGRWPLDAFFGSPCDPAAPSTGGSGYTGYRTGGAATYGVTSVAIDRRTNESYIGFNVQTVLPGGQPDYEPAVLALAPAGDLRWWSRLYHEVSATGAPANSSPDQYVDGLAIDYSRPSAALGDLVVLARCHGNNTENLWRGNAIAATPGAQGFQNQFTGTKGNIHISWLGKLALADGTLHRSTYVAEYEDAMGGTGGPAADPNLDSWPSPNASWPNLNTTRIYDMRVAADGSVAVVGVGRRDLTTRLAYQKMLRYSATPNTAAGTGAGTWAAFVRVYAPDLGTVAYSSALTGTWNTATGVGGDNTTLEAVLPEAGRVLVVGWHKQDAAVPGTAAGNPVPATAVPAWGAAAPAGQSGLLASLRTTTTAPLPVTLTQFEARRTGPTTVLLSWRTATERYNAGFVVEKGVNGESFGTLGQLAGHGTSQVPHTYSLPDEAATTGAYYRLAQRDTDGSSTYSAVLYVAPPAGSAQLLLFPNPAHGEVRLHLAGTAPTGELQVLDVLGRVRLTQPVAPSGTIVPVADRLPAGVYQVQVPTAAGLLSRRLVVN